MLRRLSPILIICLALAGCGGGGGGSTNLPHAAPTNPGSPTSTLTVGISIQIPPATNASAASKRQPRYVSASTNSASIAVDGGTAVAVNLSATSSACQPATGSGRTCTINVSATPGSHTFTVSLFASTDGSGAVLSTNAVTQVIAAGTANTVSIVLGGVVASVVLSLANATPPSGTATKIGLNATFKDASGASIVGNDAFANPVTVTDSDSSGTTTLSKTALNSLADVNGLNVAYSGATLSTPAVFGATAANLPPSAVTTATLTPAAPTTTPTAFVDWASYGFDTQRTGFNPTTTGITPASIANFHIAWQVAIKSSMQSQPLVITNVGGHKALLIVAAFGNAQAYDAFTGNLVWSTPLPSQGDQSCGTGAISGTAAYDKALGAIFMVAGNGSNGITGTFPNDVILYKLDAATGTLSTQHADITPNLLTGEATYSHAGVSFANGLVYVGTGSACEGNAAGKPSWRGRLVAVDPSAMTVTNTFYPTWGYQGNNWGGGGLWAWGGVSADNAGNVFTSTGNGEDARSIRPQTSVPAPFTLMPDESSAYANGLVELSSSLGSVENVDKPAFNFAIGGHDLDYTGVPVVAEASSVSGCGELTATMGKGGELVINNPNNGLNEVKKYNLSVPTPAGYFMGNPGYSPLTGLFYAPIPTSGNGSAMLPPGLAAIGSCGSSIAWTTRFGPDSAAYAEAPRSMPTITAGGVVFMGTPCTNDGNGGCGTPSGAANGALWAVNAADGTVLNNNKPLVITGDNIRMAPSADGLWLFLLDKSGNMYGLTVDPSVPRVTATTARTRVSDPLHIH